MARKKVFILFAAISIISLFCGICCFAADDNSINLGNTVSETINKAGRHMENMKDDMFKGSENTNDKTMVDNGVRHLNNGINHLDNGAKDVGNAIVNTTRMTTNGTYNAIRTDANMGMDNTGFGNMTTTTWMWIVLAVSAAIIIAAVLYYATQNSGRD